MALFKVFKGSSEDLQVNRPKTNEGFCYFTPDDGKFYIDITSGEDAVIGVNRIPLSGRFADVAYGAKKAITDEEGNEFTVYYATKEELEAIRESIPEVSEKAEGLTTSAGSTSQPVYFNSEGKPVAIGYTIKTSVPENAVFTDTTYSTATTSAAGLMSAADKSKLAGIAAGAEVNVNADWNATSGDAQILNKPTIPSKTSQLTNDSGFLTSVASASTSTAGIVQLTNSVPSTSTTTAATPSSVKVVYDLANSAKSSADAKVPTTRKVNGKALSADITLDAADVGALASDGKAVSAATADKLGTDAGSATQPVYFSNGVPVKTTYTLGASVPSGAKFTDTTYSAGTGISLSGTTFSNTGVRSIATGSTNGTISVNTNGTSANVAVKGLGSAAYTASTAYDAAGTAQTKADAALASAKTYADSAATTVKNDLLNGAGAAYDTLKELGDLIDKNTDVINALEKVAAGKQDKLTAGSNITISGTTISAKDTTYSNFVKSGSGAKAGLVPAPSTTAGTTKYLREDGTWQVPPDTNTTYSAAGTDLGLVKSGGDVTISSGVITVNDSSHNHAASNITSGTLSSDRLPTVSIAKGGTGATTAAGALTNLGLTATAAEINIMDGVTATTAEINKLDGLTATTAELNYVDGVTSNVQTQLNSKLDKTTYEWSKEISFGSTGSLCIGKFPMYDSNITIEISSTTNTTYNATLVVASQNINTTGGGTLRPVVYGDANNTIAPNIYLEYGSGSNVVSIYFVPTGWSKNLIHIQALGLPATPTDICTSVTTVPSTATIKPANALKDNFALISHSHNYAGSSSAGGAATSANKINTDAGSATQPVYFANGVPVKTTYTLGKSVPSDAKFTDTTYGNATTTAAGLMSSTDKTKLDSTNIAYGTCATEAATAAKVVTVTGNTNWVLKNGSLITVLFSATNTAESPTLNVNGTGAKNIYYGSSQITTSNLGYGGTASRPMSFMYDGTQYRFVGWGYDSNTTYTNVKLGHGYATCSTAAATVAKVASLSSYTLITGGIVAVRFTYDVPANATLNINSKGAKAIYYRNTPITAGVIKAGDTATFIYSTYYRLISIDRWQEDIDDIKTALDGKASTTAATTSAAGLMSAADKTKLDGIATGANAYSLPTATSSILGGVKIGDNISISSGVISVPEASGTIKGVTIVYPADSCTTFSSDSGTVTPKAVQKGAELFAITRPPKRASDNPANPGEPGTCTTNNIVRWLNAAGDVQDSKITIEDVTNTRDTSKKAQVIAIPAEGDKKMVYGYCTDQVDGTSFIGGVFDASATSYPYNQGLAIGGTSGNLLWKGSRVLDNNDLTTLNTAINGKLSTSGTAAKATALTSSAGSATQPVYFSGGKPVATTYTLEASVPSNAKFTDTTYSIATSSTAGLMSAAHKIKLDDLDPYRIKISSGRGGYIVGYASATSEDPAYMVVTKTENNTNAWWFEGSIEQDSTLKYHWSKDLSASYGGTATVLMSTNAGNYTMPLKADGTSGSQNVVLSANADLQTTNYLNVGTYIKRSNTAITNCPVATNIGFIMSVYSPNSSSDNVSTSTWVYRVRKILAHNGDEYVQYVYSQSTAGSYTYGTWNKILTSADTVSNATKVTVTATTSNTNYYLVGATGTGSQSLYRARNSSGSANTKGCYFNGSTGVLYGAAWNDYAEYRITTENIEPGRCVFENGDDTLSLSTDRLQRGCEIVSDTFGFAIGETDESKTPIAATGRVLAYPYESREEFVQHIGWPVCSGPNGTVSIMTEEEEEKYPSRIIGTISAVPDYEEWGSGNIKVNGRIWIRIK